MIDDFFNKISVVLINPSNSGNVGAIARSMANFGLKKLIIVGNYEVDEVARNRAKHANKILNDIIFVKNFDEAKSLFNLIIGTTGIVGTDYNLPRSPLLVGDLPNLLKNINGDIGIFFGPEDKGLSNNELLLCDFVVNIPCSDDYSVMNLSQSAVIIFYELFKNFNDKSELIKNNHPLSTTKERDVAYEVIEEIINNIDFKAKSDQDTQKILWKRIISKSLITKREMSSLIGFFRNIDFSLKNKDKNFKK